MLVAGALVAFASHGDELIDLTYEDAFEVHNTAVFLQGGSGAGTGQYDPFFTVKSNQDTERGSQHLQRRWLR